MKAKLFLCASLLALPFAANAQKVIAHCYDLRVNKVIAYTGKQLSLTEDKTKASSVVKLSYTLMKRKVNSLSR
jgi:hypothetical protein